MQINQTIAKIKHAYFDSTLDFHAHSFNILAFAGMVTGVIVAFFSVVTRAGVANVMINLAVSASAYIMLKVIQKRKYYHLCAWITIIAIFLIAFPVLFFTAGGYKSGMPCFFLFAFVFTAFMLDKWERVAALTLEFTLYVACSLTAYYFPETVSYFPTEFATVCDVIVGIVVSGSLLLAVLIRHVRIFQNRQVEIQELNRELTARNETLAQYDKMKSDFLATVAHEINTPLAVISASSNDTLDLLGESPLNLEEIKQNQKLIIKRIKLIDNIMLDLMDTVAIENGRLFLNRQPVNLSEWLKNICDIQFEKLDNNNNRITYDLHPGLPQIWLDPLRIEQVMTNLLSNAVKHTKDGEITVSLSSSEKGQTVSVTDNGEGMDEEMARIVLRQYVSTKADYWRHGIGLYICRRIVTAHRGDIGIDSAKGRGTTISFTLPEEKV